MSPFKKISNLYAGSKKILLSFYLIGLFALGIISNSYFVHINYAKQGSFTLSTSLLLIALWTLNLTLLKYYRTRLLRLIYALLFCGLLFELSKLGLVHERFLTFFYTSLVMVLAPTYLARSVGRGVKLHSLRVLSLARLIVIMPYFLSGAWKFYEFFTALGDPETLVFHPKAFAYHLAIKDLTAGYIGPFNEFFYSAPLTGAPFMFAAACLQIASLPLIAFTKNERYIQILGFLLIAFHLVTGILMNGFFAIHILLLMTFFISTPTKHAPLKQAA